MDELAFHKMHGLGNDFVILDRRSGKPSLSAAQVRRIADRRLGVGCDQLLSLEPSERRRSAGVQSGRIGVRRLR
jgi:diaminopimelate epimerase